MLLTDNEIESAMQLYSEMVFRLAYARLLNYADTQDVYQEVFLSYVRKSPAFISEEHRKAWLIRVTINHASKAAKQRSRTVPVDCIDDEMPCENTTQRDIELLEAIASLPPKYREVIYLFYFEDIPAAKIAEILHRKKSTVTVQLTRGREMLKALLTED